MAGPTQEPILLHQKKEEIKKLTLNKQINKKKINASRFSVLFLLLFIVSFNFILFLL